VPRKHKPPVASQGVPYGQGQVLADAQRQMPLQPGGKGPLGGRPETALNPPHPKLDPNVGTLGKVGLLEAATAAAKETAPPGAGLAAPSARPGEPVTAGLPIGAGPGPQALGLPMLPEEDPTLRALMLAYERSGSQALGRLIEIVRNRAGARSQMLAKGDQARRAIPTAGRRPL